MNTNMPHYHCFIQRLQTSIIHTEHKRMLTRIRYGPFRPFTDTTQTVVLCGVGSQVGLSPIGGGQLACGSLGPGVGCDD